jgi:hypothetical protein
MKAAEPNHGAIFSGDGSICAEVLLLEPGEGLLRCREMPNCRRGVGYLATIVPPNSANTAYSWRGPVRGHAYWSGYARTVGSP